MNFETTTEYINFISSLEEMLIAIPFTRNIGIISTLYFFN